MKLCIWAVVLLLFFGAVDVGFSQTIDNQKISGPSDPNDTTTQNEEQVFYCPTNGNVIVAAWRDFQLGYRRCSIGRSTDGGDIWDYIIND